LTGCVGWRTPGNWTRPEGQPADLDVAVAFTPSADPEELAAELAPSVGLHNVLTHQYVALDPGVVRSVPLALVSYRRYPAAVAAFLLT